MLHRVEPLACAAVGEVRFELTIPKEAVSKTAAYSFFVPPLARASGRGGNRILVFALQERCSPVELRAHDMNVGRVGLEPTQE